MQRPAGPAPNFVGQNAFAALDTKKVSKKKKDKTSDKDDKRKKDKAKPIANGTQYSSGALVSSQPSFRSTNWADDESDDDDFDVMPMANWMQEEQDAARQAELAAAEEEEARRQAEAARHEEDIEAALGIEVDRAEESDEEEGDTATEAGASSAAPSRNVSEIAPRSLDASAEGANGKSAQEIYKQLSKKEQKKKEMEELAAVLGELGIDSSAQNALDGAPGEDSGKVKKKKKPAKVKAEGAAPSAPAPSEPEPAHEPEEPVTLVDPAEAKRKLAASASKKKKSVNPALAKAAAVEAQIRAKKVAAEKAKDKKKHYNQERR